MYVVKILTVFLLFSTVLSRYIEITAELNGEQWWGKGNISFNSDNIEYIRRYQSVCLIYYECYQKGYYQSSDLCSWVIDSDTCNDLLDEICKND